MISDAEVAAVLPAKGWIADYMKFTAKALYAPRIFSLGMAHSLMLASTPFGHIRVGATKVSPTFFGLNIGSSGDGKTTAIDAGIDILGIENTAPSFASSNAFVEYLKVNPRTYISFGEFGRFLAETEDSVKTPLKTTFNDAFDGSPLANLLAGQVRNGNITKVTRYHLGIYGGVTPEYLARHTESVDWTSGFFARFGYFWGATPKSRPTQWDESLAGTLRGTLRALRDSADQFDGYPGYIGTDAAAQKLFDAFEADLHQIRGKGAALSKRAMTLARKFSLSYALDFGGVLTPSWKLTAREVEPAIELAKLSLRCGIAMFESIPENSAEKMRLELLTQLELGPKKLSALIRDAPHMRRTIMEIIETLMAAHLIEKDLESDAADPTFTRTQRRMTVIGTSLNQKPVGSGSTSKGSTSTPVIVAPLPSAVVSITFDDFRSGSDSVDEEDDDPIWEP